MKNNNPYDNPDQELLDTINKIAEETNESVEAVTKILKVRYRIYTEQALATLSIE